MNKILLFTFGFFLILSISLSNAFWETDENFAAQDEELDSVEVRDMEERTKKPAIEKLCNCDCRCRAEEKNAHHSAPKKELCNCSCRCRDRSKGPRSVSNEDMAFWHSE